jgi:tRNA(fMet)-specific endonuclease VapC
MIKSQIPRLKERLQKLTVGDLAISAITLAEMEYGIARSRWKERNRATLDEFTAPLVVIPFDRNASEQYGEIRHYLETKGIPIGSMDLLIAAHALSLGITLVTNNTREFSRIKGLKLEDWSR